MSEYKKEISAAVVAAIVIAAGLGTISIYSFPGALTSTVVKTTTLSTSTVASSVTFMVTSSTTQLSTSNGPPASTTTSFTSAQWEPGQVVGLVLNSSVVQSYIGSAYSYDVVALGSSPSNSNLIVVTVNVTGTQSVSGNYTSGYEVSCTGIRTLNAEVLFAAPSSYTLNNVSVAVLPSVNQSITYDTQQQQVVQVALSNSTVKGLIGAQAFYVESVTPVPIQNGTYAGEYFVFMYQVNGPKEVGVFVNGGLTAVVNSYTSSRAETMCFTLGTSEGVPASDQQACFTSPWNSTS